MVFETKKVPLETLGEYLAEIRSGLGLTVTEVAEKTGIADKFLQHLEAGMYFRLPPDVYVFGFLKKLADLYSISSEVLLSQYKRERGITERTATEKISVKKGIKARLSKLVVTPKLISLFGGIGLSLFAMFYIAFQVSAINKTPSLVLEQPLPGTVVKDSMVTVIGHTDPGTIIAINGENVFVDSEGKFTTLLGVAVGQKELDITAQNKYGKTTTQKLSVIVDSNAVPNQGQVAAAETKPLLMEIKFARATTITVKQDGIDLPEEVVPADGIKRLDAKSEVVLKTSDAGGTMVTVNGKSIGPLGRNHESLTVPFTTDNQLLTGATKN